MFKNVIKRYINIITINDVIMFGAKENINVSQEEANIILNHLKNNWENIIYGNEKEVKRFLNNNFDHIKSEQIFRLFLEYKKKYRNYL
ncbi:MAG: DUF2624 family protein [Bacilli bacterium]|nr:DUF2624 family protein [Bacilli bacterium]